MGGLLQKPVTIKQTERGGGERMTWGAVSMQGWRPDQEDAHVANADIGEELAGCGIYCVFDGHGGKAVSAFCKLNFVAELRRLTQDAGRKAFGKNKSKKRHCGVHLEPSEFEDILKGAFTGMDVQLRDPANAKRLASLVGKVPGGAIQDLRKTLSAAQVRHKRGELSVEEQLEMKENYIRLQKFEQADKGEDFVADNVGCTAICVLVRKGDILAANAGDSRAVLCRGGQQVELSFDHKPASETEKARIEAAGGYLEDSPGGARVNGNLNLSRAIGDLEYKKRDDLEASAQIITSSPDIITKELTPEDEFIVLCCDGVWDVMTNQEVCDFVRPRLLEGKEEGLIGEELLDKCISPDPQATSGLGTDNMTVVIVKLNEAKLWTKD
eukprot:gnl/TRDRNA2_/TRDRNA2_194744_c0_seq1.p1 gnl/TRDRNA2_/TRDRNA2_194744_c0~~gnl/TRDRNA2_/TRDRNA2_194744_c0_seq1.p1  ORF type:complete len:383 (-),score=89.64 gnl/TRDRNA2_/TRDRNA2_194744_c0_seq1:82-1230(-)